ncbi:MAG: two-component regulator propeller domain-containing protein, partial [Aliidongia sp.]
EKDGHWQTYTNASTMDGLPTDFVFALAPGPENSLWVGTLGGLARLDKDGHWQTYTEASTKGGLPDDSVSALSPGPEGSLWVGTPGGLAQLDKDGHWQTYTKASSEDGLPSDNLSALLPGPEGSLWVGTFGHGLCHFTRPIGQNLRIVEVIGKTGEITQADQTIAVAAWDGDYLTEPRNFRYVWRMNEIGLFGAAPEPEIRTNSSVYRVKFPHDGAYRLSVVAVDKYGNRSEKKDIDFNVTLPKPKSFWERLLSAWPVILAGLTCLYFFAFLTLLFLTRWYSWAFRILSDEVWAKWLTIPFALIRHFRAVQLWVLEPWFQEVRMRTRTDLPFLDPPAASAQSEPREATTLLHRQRDKPRLWLHGRSGMGKSSVFAGWVRAYFTAADLPSLGAAFRRYGFILIPLSVRDYAALPPPDANRPESWVVGAVRAQLEQFGFATRDLGLIEAMLKAGHIALALDGLNEADRDLAFTRFATQFRNTGLLVTSQTIPVDDKREKSEGQWEVWELPPTIDASREQLLRLWLGDDGGAILSRRIAAAGIAGMLVSGYDLRLLADLAASDPERAALPPDRIALYKAILGRALAADGERLALDGLEQLAWSMLVERRRRITGDDARLLGPGTLARLAAEGVRIVRPIGAEHEFRHDQMRTFLAGSWLVEETPNLPSLQKAAIEAGAFELNRRDQEDLWGFVAPLLAFDAALRELWNFAGEEPGDRAFLLAALQAEADARAVTLTRVARQHEIANV